MQGTVLMALLQPAPEVYELFDDILLLAEGHVIFHGPKEDVLPFFEGLGFKLPARKGIGDFLQEVTSPSQVVQEPIPSRMVLLGTPPSPVSPPTSFQKESTPS